VWPETQPGFQPPLPDAIVNRGTQFPHPHPPTDQPPVAPFDEELPKVAQPPAPPRALRRVLLDAGVRGLGPLGPGFELSEQEMAQELQWVYRHIAKSLCDTLFEQPGLSTDIVAALAHDARDEREMGLLLIAHPPLGEFLQQTVSPGLLNRWQQAGDHLLRILQEHPRGVIADLHLVEPPVHRWRP
jgi:hypothetical protein